VAIEIRSYRSVFDLERRIYRIDRLRLNPGGVPVRGAVYCIFLLLGVLLAGATPLVGVAVRALPWYLRELALPLGAAALLSVIRVEGRPFHLAARALLRYATGPRRLAGLHARGAACAHARGAAVARRLGRAVAPPALHRARSGAGGARAQHLRRRAGDSRRSGALGLASHAARISLGLRTDSALIPVDSDLALLSSAARAHGVAHDPSECPKRARLAK
jgi:hypothetical protein